MSVKCSSSGQYISNTSVSVPLGSPFTVAMWVKHNVSNGTYSTALFLGVSASLNTGYFVKFDTGGADTDLRANLAGSAATLDAPTIGTWEYVVFTTDGTLFGSDCASMYLGGTSLNDKGGITNTASGTAGRIFVGCDTDTTLPYSGSFAHVRVWTSTLSLANLYTESQSSTPVITSGLVLSWPLATNSDTTDQSGNGKTPTFTGGVTTDTGPLSGPVASIAQAIGHLSPGIACPF
jgi:Concanavalin A-like lectin/glucanases superfamily